jgi:hypothetical protein
VRVHSPGLKWKEIAADIFASAENLGKKVLPAKVTNLCSLLAEG